MEVCLKLAGVTIRRGERELLTGLDCDIDAGQVVAVLGPNGAGKSSLLLALAGLIPATGKIELSGRALYDFSRTELVHQIAWQGDLPPTEFGLTVHQRLELAAGKDVQRVSQTADLMDIAPLLKRPLGRLSSGERQRVEIAAVMVRDCPIWFFDEPTAHLDLKHQMTVMKMFREEAVAGRTIVTVLHDLSQAAAIADCVILLDGNGGAESGDAAGLLTKERLSSLFQVKLSDFGSGLLLPDYSA